MGSALAVGPIVAHALNLDALAGALVDAGLLDDPDQVAVAVVQCKTLLFDVVRSERTHVATAVESVGRVVAEPDGIIGAIDPAVHRGMCRPRVFILDSTVRPVWTAIDIRDLLAVSAVRRGRCHIGTKDGSQSLRVTNVRHTPPTECFQVDLHVAHKLSFTHATL